MKEKIPKLMNKFVKNNEVERQIELILNNRYIILEGETSGGKTEIVKYLASIYNTPMIRFNVG